MIPGNSQEKVNFSPNWAIITTKPAGVTVGFPVMLLLIGLVLRPVMEQYSVLFNLLKYASVAYILYIAWHVAVAPVDARILPEEHKPPITFVQSVMFQWINPKAWAGALTTVTVYTAPEHYRTSLFVAAFLSAVTIVGAISLWALMGRQIKHFLDRPAQMRAFNVVMALLLVVSVGMMVGGSRG